MKLGLSLLILISTQFAYAMREGQSLRNTFTNNGTVPELSRTQGSNLQKIPGFNIDFIKSRATIANFLQNAHCKLPQTRLSKRGPNREYCLPFNSEQIQRIEYVTEGGLIIEYYRSAFQKIMNLSAKIMERNIRDIQLLQQNEIALALLHEFEMSLTKLMQEPDDNVFYELLEMKEMKLFNDLSSIDNQYQKTWDLYQQFRPRVAEDPELFVGMVMENAAGTFVIDKKLGSGTRCHVFEATVYPGEIAPGQGRKVAIKEFPDLNLDENFHNEVFVLRHLDQLDDVGVIIRKNGHRLVVMKYHSGYEMTDLIKQLRQRPTAIELLLDPHRNQKQYQALIQLRDEYAESLRQLHRKGVIHGDAWPSNVLVCHGVNGCEGNKYAWIDFELAKLSSREEDFDQDLAYALMAFDAAARFSPRELVSYGRTVWNPAREKYEYVLPPLHPNES